MDWWVRAGGAGRADRAPCRTRSPLAVVGLLALLLFLGLPPVRTSNRTRRQDVAGGLRCHVCEMENDFKCENPVTCETYEPYCNFVAAKVFPRNFYVSKQCSSFCPYVWPIENSAPTPEGFLLEKPLPFFYVNCCKSSLCNLNGPSINEDVFREQAGRAHVRTHNQAILTVLVATALTSPTLL